MRINSIEDILALITNQVSESKEIDYKELLNLSSSEEKIKFLQNITSFANAVGGNLILGVKEEKGNPIEIVGIEINDNDKLILQIENILRDLIEPRINNISFNFIPISDSKQVLVINIPNSWNKPHVVKVNKYWSFHSRNSVGKYPLDLSEIRNQFLFSSSLIENVKSFKSKRISNIISDQTPIPIPSEQSGKFVIHVIPFDGFNTSSSYNIALFKETRFYEPFLVENVRHLTNFDGLLFYGITNDQHRLLLNYIQIFRNGIIEAVDLDMVNDPTSHQHLIYLLDIENKTYELIEKIFIYYQKLGLSCPYYISISFLNVKNGIVYFDPRKHNRAKSLALNQDNYFLSDLLVESLEDNLEEKLSEIFISMWNAFGFENKLN